MECGLRTWRPQGPKFLPLGVFSPNPSQKGSDALLHSMKAKTRPAVRNMYRSAKSGLKGVQNLLTMKVRPPRVHSPPTGDSGKWSGYPSPPVHPFTGWRLWPAEGGLPENPKPPQPLRSSATAPAYQPALRTGEDNPLHHTYQILPKSCICPRCSPNSLH